ncbi:hypothetical protein KAR91_02085 [Candidatus Pacearchaeota archaeon]|nr:hypothetical protein [Candidatus Pacearchaeota archaeon]
MVLFTFTNRAGIERRCDESCYDSNEEHCSCVCGSVNHGMGFDVARKRTHQILIAIVRRLGPGESITMGHKTQQQEMFK